jgi:hypothetical protein
MRKIKYNAPLPDSVALRICENIKILTSIESCRESRNASQDKQSKECNALGNLRNKKKEKQC